MTTGRINQVTLLSVKEKKVFLRIITQLEAGFPRVQTFRGIIALSASPPEVFFLPLTHLQPKLGV